MFCGFYRYNSKNLHSTTNFKNCFTDLQRFERESETGKLGSDSSHILA
jgi:hypothetical protein